MAFDYLESNLSKRFSGELEPRFGESFEAEVRQRAHLLFNLKYPLQAAIDRISSNITWEFDDTWTGGPPAIHKKTAALVKEVYKHLTR